ncbi:hypothetical protein BU24DRAFT_456572 [Aaosphaeria arxii CBS 175.79]|uniref:Fungal N-terminal domain-containing protein n=1 Tax=Aaosphaeria arxii CBS 175.79 TaxID=1450172 RepID=A0A6A5Y6X5_9PLEO|nr:uncharacterized protein BU24DRAFT_456572 [Aaosphaeria arxii CBS 175.79]KAF2020501.1 hypothetical protein BU24DRAFT_456572 [Aaosphaeria arxii CBS 175.79]
MNIGDALDIARLLKQAYDLYKACKAAPEEIRLAADYVHTMTLVLESVKSDLVTNKASFMHQKTALAKAKQQKLAQLIKRCQASVTQQERVLKKFQRFKADGGLGAYNKWKWSTSGKKEIADAKSELVLSSNLLNIFISTETVNILYKIEAYIEVMMPKIAALDLFPNDPRGQLTSTTPRPRSDSNVKVTIILSLVIARLKRTLDEYRWKQARKNKKLRPGPRRPQAVTRVNSGLVPNKNRDSLVQSYASQIVIPSNQPPGRSIPPRTPSPDFYLIDDTNNTTDPIPRPIRRTSSIQRITRRINARTVQPRTVREHFECWKVGVPELAIGLKVPPKYLHQRRGQAQLRKMAEVFNEASKYDKRALNEKSVSVKHLLKHKNKDEKKGKRWYLAGGRLIARDVGNSGFLIVEKSLVILVRR